MSIPLSLIFFVLYLTVSCERKAAGEITINWDHEKAVSLSIPTQLLDGLPKDSIKRLLIVSLDSTAKVPIFGEATFEKGNVVFKPLVPFTRGLGYEIFAREKSLGKVNIPKADETNLPGVVAVYPSGDSLPENLLKFYIEFSHPMREGEALKHVGLFSEENERIDNVFLDLRPELWNEDRTTLTVWLDPGRIKRDLVPNKEMGNPLIKNQKYRLKISSQWKDAQGLTLNDSVSKLFIVTSRDSACPTPESWKFHLPAAQTKDVFRITAPESMDYFLFKETLAVTNQNNTAVQGTWRITNNETTAEFFPIDNWSPGNYRLRVASHLEDIAGNNLNRPFDRDISNGQPRTDHKYFERDFKVK